MQLGDAHGGEQAGTDPFALAAEAASCLAERTGAPHHDVAVVLGTGLSPAAEVLGGSGPPIDVHDLPGFHPFGGAGHRAAVWSLAVHGRRVLVLAGRAHLYEGRSAVQVAHPVRTAVAAGCHSVVLTCSAGSLRTEVAPGTPVLIADHLNLTGASPLTGMAADHPAGSPFVDLTTVWTPALRALARRADPTLLELVYAQVPGPHLETAAEVRMLGILGADLVGMSTVLEAIAAHHLGAAVLGVAMATNPAAGLADHELSPEQIIASATLSATRLGQLLDAVIANLPEPVADGSHAAAIQRCQPSAGSKMTPRP